MFRNGLTIVKFGSSVLRGEEDLPLVVEEIGRWLGSDQYVLAVVSAFGNRTEELFKRASAYGEPTNEEAVARLVATGEEEAAALLGLALARAGIGAKILCPEQIRLIAEGAPLDARPCGVRVEHIWSAFTQSEVVVVPGFIARTAKGTTVLLGRGGSDLTALFLAHGLRASRCGWSRTWMGFMPRTLSPRSVLAPNATCVSAGKKPSVFTVKWCRRKHWSSPERIG